jgi:cardiolipin synthase
MHDLKEGDHRPAQQKEDEHIAPEPTFQTKEHQITLVPDMSHAIVFLEGDIKAAKERIWIETYIYRDDKMGHLFANWLEEAVQRGADVRLLYDPQGSQKTSEHFFQELIGRGIQVRPYRSRSMLWPLSRWPRAHSRIVIIDQKAYAGGAAWGNEWLPHAKGGEGWHDVCVRVEGAVVDNFERAYKHHWYEARHEQITPKDLDTLNQYEELELLVDAPEKYSIILNKYRERIQNAKKRIWIENSYFYPPKDFMQDLYDAAARGVEVKLILPGETDVPGLQPMIRSDYAKWIEHGLEVYEYQPAVLHSKFAVIDDDWATVGSFNANITSVAFAHETALFVYDPAFTARLARCFRENLESARRMQEVHLSLWILLYVWLIKCVVWLLEVVYIPKRRLHRATSKTGTLPSSSRQTPLADKSPK